MSSGVLLNSTGKVLMLNNKALYYYDYLKFTSENANVIERCTWETLYNGVRVSATSNYGRASFIFPVESGKRYNIEFDAVAQDGYKMIYFHNAAFKQGDGWDVVYGTMSVAAGGHFTKTINSNSNVLWIGIYASANTKTGIITLTNATLEEI